MKNKSLFRLIKYLIYDIIVTAAAALVALLIIDGSFQASATERPRLYLLAVMLNCALLVAAFFALKIYNSSNAYRSVIDAVNITLATLFCAVIHWVICVFSFGFNNQLTAYILLFWLFLVVLTAFPRFYARAVLIIKRSVLATPEGLTPIMIVGAGDAGVMLAREVQNSEKIKYTAKCFVDDDAAKIGTYILGIRVAGATADIPALAESYGVKEIYIAMPSADMESIRRINEICSKTQCKVKSLPGIYQFMKGDFSMRSFKDISIEDLLARRAVKVDLDKIMEYVNDKVVMVTGGGGSIGSELCRQIAAHSPHQLIIVDIYENNAYDIQQELVKKYPALDLKVLIASVRDEKRMERIFATYKPQIVYHAAAHKHVPLMEESPNEAIKNNVFGTFKTAKLADKYGVKKFVLISTDKAVNPTNVMGATKRMCEMIVQSFNKQSATEFVAVRFGNVLGSNGSVVPLFKKQIAEGGPVLVTHPDIIRYFMTIPEAVALVIQAGAYAKGGEIFVLDMGKPVKILDLAENIIKLSGYVPYKDIDIKFTGLRPGEKLYEEMLMDEEGLQETENKLIHIGKPIEMDEQVFFEKLEELRHTLEAEPTNTRRLISEIVPTYKGNPELANI